MPKLDRQDNVFVLDLGDGENRFHPGWVADVTPTGLTRIVAPRTERNRFSASLN